MLWRRRQQQGHDRVRELLSPYLNGAGSPQERAQVERHLATCPTCRRELEELRATVHLVRSLPQVAPPRSFTLAEAPPKRFQVPALPWAVPLASATAAMLFLLLVAGQVTGLLGPTPAAAPVSEPLSEAAQLDGPAGSQGPASLALQSAAEDTQQPPAGQEEKATAATLESPEPAREEQPQGPLFQLPLLPWLQGAGGALAAGMGVLWLLRRRRYGR